MFIYKMFTGIVQFVYKILINKNQIWLYTDDNFLKIISVGDSVSIDGVCLTVVNIFLKYCTFDISNETISKTTFQFYMEKMANVELALKYGSYLGGHLMLGHVHQTATITSVDSDLWVDLHACNLVKYKGCIAINGVSLTVAEISDTKVRIALIPETIKRTNFKYLNVGDVVNVEFDLPSRNNLPFRDNLLFGNENIVHDDSYYMRLAMTEGEKGRITAPPNPWVGCVIVKDGEIISSGYHKRAGEAHAEVIAINAAQNVEGSILYVTLEPCCHYGRTPPCTNLLIKSKIKRVVVGIVDPDTRVSGKGIQQLRDNGIEVDMASDKVVNEIKYSLRQYIHHRTVGTYFTLKIALSLDNCYRNENGSSKWITHEETRKVGHVLRANSQAIIVGANTVQHDDPELTVRYDIPVIKQPDIIVIDGESLMPTVLGGSKDGENKKIITSRTSIVTTESMAHKWPTTVSKIIVSNEKGQMNVHDLVQQLGGYMHCLIEGGSKIQRSFCNAGLVNEIVIFRSSKVFGVNAYQWSAITPNMQLHLVESKTIPSATNDVMERYLVTFGDPIKNISDNLSFDDVHTAVKHFAQGGMVLVMDDESRENEGDLIVAASKITESQMVEMINNTTGMICVPMEQSRAKKLNLPLMCSNNTDTFKTAFTITVDAVGTSTGVSSADKLMTVKCLANAQTNPTDLHRPGHIFPLIAHPEGLAARQGHTEASIALCKLANIYPRVTVIAELQNKDGTMSRGMQCYHYAKSTGIPIITVKQLCQVMENEQPKVIASCDILSIDDSKWRMICYDSGNYNQPHKVFVYPSTGFSRNSEPISGSLPFGNAKLLGDAENAKLLGDAENAKLLGDAEPIENAIDVVPVRIHSECFTGDVFKSKHCDCGEQLHAAMQYIIMKGRGVIIFPAEHEGRGIGISNKVKAYNLQQERCLNTLEANEQLGFDSDARTYTEISGILQDLQISKIELLTENPNKILALKKFVVKTTPVLTNRHEHNEKYLTVKKDYFQKFSKEAPQIDLGHDNQSLKIAIVFSMWHSSYIDQIRDKLKTYLHNYGIINTSEFEVPGSNEVPFRASQIASNFDGIICVGILLKGDTLHFENVSGAVSNGIMQAQIQTGVPMMNCILSCLDISQVIDRITGPKSTLEYVAKSLIKMILG